MSDSKDYTKMQISVTRKSLCCVIALVLTVSFCSIGIQGIQAQPAYAATEETEAVLTELQKEIEKSAQDYDTAAAQLATLESQVEENKTRIEELERDIPAQQEKSDTATVSLYKLQQEGFSLIEMVLSSQSLEEFLASTEYLHRVQVMNFNEINRLIDMKKDLEETKTSLDASKTAAEEEKKRAEEALAIAQKQREEAQQKALEEARIQEAAAAAAAAAEEAAQKKTESAPQNDTPSITPSGGPSKIDWSVEKTAFVDEWTARINTYLAGSPLAGKGVNFAEASWNYGVDPRWSPAISTTESSTGRNCFFPHNAWGWGRISWDSWDEAIDAHVRGLAKGYGYTISIEAAKKYCAEWEHWYNTTLNQMNKI